MSDTILFNPPGGTPAFAGKGSRIEHPDVLPIFWGPYWPGSGSFTSFAIMQAIRSIANSPYLNGLKQYGYAGPVRVRNEMINSSAPGITLPHLPGITQPPPFAPGVQQTESNITTAVYTLINGMLNDDAIDDVDDNHDLIVVVFLDPSIPFPPNQAGTGIDRGANSWIDKFEFLDDNTRFEWVWVATPDTDLARVSTTFSHELAESISDPFNNGWEQTSPPPLAGQGQIGDVCNQLAIVDGVSVAAYWSNADNACIVPLSGTRRVSLSYTVKAIGPPTDSHVRQAFVDLGRPLCAAGYFDYFERTYHNHITIRADARGYESPVFAWTINGQSIKILGDTLEVDADWELPPASKYSPVFFRNPTATLHTYRYGGTAAEMTIDVGPNEGNFVIGVGCAPVESFDTFSAGGVGSTTRNASILVDVKNQEIVWGEDYQQAKKNCDHVRHLSDGPNRGIPGPPPGDPPDLAQILSRLLIDPGPDLSVRIRRAAELIRNFSTELADALMAHAERLK